MRELSRRRFLTLSATTPLAALLGCQSVPTIFGYKIGAGALYDPNIQTVYVPLFNNRAFQTSPYRGFEVDVTKAVVDEIGRTTSFRVVSDPDRADTELQGNIVTLSKNITNRTQQNTVRDGDVVVTVDVVWRDLRDGTILSAPRRNRTPGLGAIDVTNPPISFDPTLTPPPPVSETPLVVPTRIVASGRYIQELGETNASASKRVHDQIAVQIVSMMERKW